MAHMRLPFLNKRTMIAANHNRRWPLAASVLLAVCSIFQAKPANVISASPYYTFATGTPQAVLGKGVAEAPLNYEGQTEDGFCLKLDLNVQPGFDDAEILGIDNVLSVCLYRDYTQKHKEQNYTGFRLPDGRVPVLQATLQLRETGEITVGLPLSMLKKPWGKHEVVLNFSGIDFTLHVDGQLFDKDFAIGYPPKEMFIRWHRNARHVTSATLFWPAAKPQQTGKKSRAPQELQYFTPRGHNAWVGDVVTCQYRGRYHVFYLYDRRGHRSKLGSGGHYFEHLSTADFRTWTEHEPAVSIEHQWETIGTGTPFVYNDSLYLSYGFHSTRITSAARQTLELQWQQIKEHGRTACIRQDTLRTPPAGSSYSVCTDGLARFRRSGILIHPCENPSISNSPDGRLTMLASYGARGTWTADAPDGPWRCIDENFPPGGDCTFPFRWGAQEYVIGGFTQMWMKSADGYKDMVAAGQDVYDGLSVPCITEVTGGRRLMAGWVQVAGHWGGALVVRELLQRPDGRLESRWMPELMPRTKAPKLLARLLDKTSGFNTPASSFLLSFDVVKTRPEATVSLELTSTQSPRSATWWQMDTGSGRAQFSDDTNHREKTLREGGAPHNAGNYAIEGLPTDGQRLPVRIIVKRTGKLGGSLVDVEIAGRRTMISYRQELETTRLRLTPCGAVLENVRIAPLKAE